MSNVKTIKKGEYLFKEGDKIQFVHQIQQGAVSICMIRPKKNIELFLVGVGQVLGESALQGATTQPFSAIANVETKVLEVPVEFFKQQADTASPMLKILLKSLGDRLKLTTAEVRSYKMEKDSAPCPEDQIAKIFGSLFHAANHKGQHDEKDKNKVSIDWTMMKQYAQRVFTESPKRLEQAICVLVKLKLAAFEVGKAPDDPEGPDQIQKVHFNDISAVEAFFECYQYYYFKGTGKAENLKTDDMSMNMLTQFLAISEGLQPDRFGVVAIEYSKAIERFKTDMGINLNQDHFARMEQKGVFAKRQAKADGTVMLQYELKEFQTTLKIWKILREIEKWNDKGFVDLNEDDAKAKKKSDGPSCPSCAAPLTAGAKFCSECGAKTAAA
jgi:hypothetical protein